MNLKNCNNVNLGLTYSDGNASMQKDKEPEMIRTSSNKKQRLNLFK
jgi:hypothetical protein